MSKPLYLRGAGRGRGKRPIADSRPVGDTEEKSNSKSNDKASKSLTTEKKDHANVVLSKVIQQYEADTSSRDLGSTGNFLSRTVTDHASSCPICLEDIGRVDPIWFCSGCFTEYHIQCIQKWVRETQAQNFYRSSDAEDAAVPDTERWSCPSCRQEYHRSQDFPDRYRCYCGRVEDPPCDPWLLPHSCGEVCRRALSATSSSEENSGCSHLCLLLCHPGPCPPCPQMVQVSCHCGKSAPTSRRCSQRRWACAVTCNRLLQCLAHRCTATCHPGPCPPCRRTSLQPCVCGAERQLRPCQQLEWQCDTECGRPLACGQHSCRRVCHIGDCGLCPNYAEGGVRLCPCGKTPYSGLACTEEAPPCGDTCDRPLACGVHRCERPCHTGQCGPCRQAVERPCRCGARTTRVDCSQELVLCSSRCQRYRACRRHVCKRRCCDGNCPPCDHPCGRTLNCRSHKCPSRCHAGPCYLCTETQTARCSCGETKLTLPCGALRNKRQVVVRCELPCRRLAAVRECGHPTPVHICHPGPCRPCRDVCGRPLPLCEHRCPALCHQAVLVTPEPEQAKASGPWEARGPAKPVLRALPCPPCDQKVETRCRGDHEAVHLRCSDWTAAPVARSCGSPCGRLLACANHVCERECHGLSGPEGTNCDTCTRDCANPRPNGCTHRCSLSACHPDDCPPCAVLLRHRCHCSSMAIYVACAEWLGMKAAERRERLTCPGRCPRELDCGHQCPANCHAEPCRDTGQRCTAKVSVACACGRSKRRVPCVDRELPVPCGEKCRKAEAPVEESAVVTEVVEEKAETSTVRQRRRDRRQAGSKEEKTRRPGQFIVAYLRRFAPFGLAVMLLGLIAWAVIESTHV